MTHSIYNFENNTELTIEDGFENGLITINVYDKNINNNVTHYLRKQDLRDFIGILLHIQSKNRK